MKKYEVNSLANEPAGNDQQGQSADNAHDALTEFPIGNSVPEPKLKTGESNENGHGPGNDPPGKFHKICDWIVGKEKNIGLHDCLMVIFTGVLTLVAIGQGWLAYQNSHSSANQFQREQRPWVGFQSPNCEGCTVTAEPLQKLGPMRFHQKQYLTIGDLTSVVINTGKTPASKVQVHYTIIPLSKDESVPTWDSYTHDWAKQVRSSEPNSPAKKVLEDYAINIRGGSDPQFDLPPTVTHTVHLVQMPTMPYWRDAFGVDQLTVYVLGKITYEDKTSGQQHTTTLCLMDKNWIGGASAFTYCQTGNTMD